MLKIDKKCQIHRQKTYLCVVENIGHILNNYRKQKSISLINLSSETGIDAGLLSKYERSLRIPSDAHLQILANFHSVDFQELKKYQLAERIYSMLVDEPSGVDAFILAEPRIQYISQKSYKEQLSYSTAIANKLKALDGLRDEYNALSKENEVHIAKSRDNFALRYTYESNKIEGNTLTLSETMMVVKEGITISGKSVAEHLEAINHQEAIDLMSDLVYEEVDFNKRILLQLHGLILRGIDRKNAGKYRDINVRIMGAEHVPPEPLLVPDLMDDYFSFYKQAKGNVHPVILAAEMHERLVTIHPFIDGNGRTSRLVMNLILLMNGYPIAILKGDQQSRLRYFAALEQVQTDGNPQDFYNLVIDHLVDALKEWISLLK